MTLETTLLILTGFIAGVANAIAGGGTFFTLPVFLAAGLPPIVANASNAVAVWPAHIIASAGYRDILLQHKRALTKAIFIGLMGALIGAWLLSIVGNERFRSLIPVLIAVATLLFALGAPIRNWLTQHPTRAHLSLTQPRLIGVILQLILAVYGGFFSAGLGVMIMAMLMLLGVSDMQLNNAFKNAIASVISTVAILMFIFSDLVDWHTTLPAFAACFVGGIVGTRCAQRLSAQVLKTIVILTGVVLTLYYGYRIYVI